MIFNSCVHYLFAACSINVKYQIMINNVLHIFKSFFTLVLPKWKLFKQLPIGNIWVAKKQKFEESKKCY